MTESSIGLKTFFEFEGRVPPRSVEISTPDFYLPPEVRLPQSGITFLYGYRGSGSVVGHAINRALEHGRELCIVTAKAEVGSWTADKQSAENFDDLRFINLPSRVRAETLDDIGARWRQLLAERGLPMDDFPRKYSPNIHLLDELVKQEPYNKLTAIAYPMRTNARTGAAQLVTVFHPDKIKEVEANTNHKVRIRLLSPDQRGEATVQVNT